MKKLLLMLVLLVSISVVGQEPVKKEYYDQISKEIVRLKEDVKKDQFEIKQRERSMRDKQSQIKKREKVLKSIKKIK